MKKDMTIHDIFSVIDAMQKAPMKHKKTAVLRRGALKKGEALFVLAGGNRGLCVRGFCCRKEAVKWAQVSKCGDKDG